MFKSLFGFLRNLCFSNPPEEQTEEPDWSTFSNDPTVIFQTLIGIATEVIERTRNPLSGYILQVISRFNQEKECAEIIEITNDTSEEILLAEIKIVGSDGFPGKIQITNHGLSKEEIKLFVNMRSPNEPRNRLLLEVIGFNPKLQ